MTDTDDFDCNYCDQVYGSQAAAIRHALEEHGDTFDDAERERLEQKLAALQD